LEKALETKINVLIAGVVMLLSGFIALLFLAPLSPTLLAFGAYALIIGIIVTLFGLVEIATDKKSLQAIKKKIILIALTVIAVGLTVPSSVWTVTTPNWAFSVTTDKSTYELGEPVQIKVTLENLGFITHSFTSAVSDPVAVQVLSEPHSEVWYSSPFPIVTEFTISPRQSLERTFTWNQTNTSNPELWNQTYMPGTYAIKAFIPNPHSELVWDYDALFRAQTNINVTST
jgi:hypothetical protein